MSVKIDVQCFLTRRFNQRSFAVWTRAPNLAAENRDDQHISYLCDIYVSHHNILH